MMTLKFACELLSDVVLNAKSNTEGANTTLDFIPGNAFLGIVAKHYNDFGPAAIDVFHSGRVRFGDAHPVAGDGRVRSLRVPAAYYYPKLEGIYATCHIHHLYNRAHDDQPQQLKQCRTGFYAFADGQGIAAATAKGFAVKSAYDRDLRRAKDEQMYGYESLRKGLRLQFAVEIDDEAMAGKIRECLVGDHTLGRSRTAQYGLVHIEEADFGDVASAPTQGNLVTVYADGRLVFLDKALEPTFQPTAADLGLPDGEIDWELSQVRTFQYAPWNGKRQTREANRCGLEKGSVLVVRCKGALAALKPRYVGSYRNEGFGRVVYNPCFLQAGGPNGEAAYKLIAAPLPSPTPLHKQEGTRPRTPLLAYLQSRKRKAEADAYIYNKVNEFVEQNKRRFGSDFASQWGAVRTWAMQCHTAEEIINELFERKKKVVRTKDNKVSWEDDAFLTHGVAAKHWDKRERRKLLRQFVDQVRAEKPRYGDIVCRALVNLSSEMGKICKQ